MGYKQDVCDFLALTDYSDLKCLDLYSDEDPVNEVHIEEVDGFATRSVSNVELHAAPYVFFAFQSPQKGKDHESYA